MDNNDIILFIIMLNLYFTQIIFKGILSHSENINVLEKYFINNNMITRVGDNKIDKCLDTFLFLL